MVRISFKEAIRSYQVEADSITRIPVTMPEGTRVHGASFCVNITEISYNIEATERPAPTWTGYPFVSLKH
ncbi:MAG: hypothetical protein HPY73_04230 [Methanomassiliicoccales archaeon]|nr:MAG: hypothetical protein HPY73_04230 [Methanomassiliicoccales archaeon]